MQMRVAFSPLEIAKLRRLWSSDLSDRELAALFNRHRGVLRRAAKRIGLPSRTVARSAT